MHPANQDLLAQVRGQSIRQPVHQSRSPASSPHLDSVRRLQSEESWVDISSRTSTSSLSSTAGDETLTPSRVAPNAAFQRRRRIQRSYSAMTQGTQGTAVTDSSQEEYEESESEQDPMMTSSNEDIPQQSARSVAQRRIPIRRVPSSGSSDAVSIISSDDAATALATTQEPHVAASFHPQPNAFTQPPPHRHTQSYQPETTSYFPSSAPMARAASVNTTNTRPAHSSTPATTPGPRPTYDRANSTTRPRSHTPYNMISPNHNVSVDHDAALRASLSTLLSCAAAARGLSKRDGHSNLRETTIQAPQIAQGSLRLVPQSELDVQSAIQTQTQTRTQTTTLPAPIERPSSPTQSMPRRKSKSKSPSPSRMRRKNRTATTVPPYSDIESAAVLSPTMLWVIGAGVFVLGSAVLFTAGYAIGKEVGYVNGLSDAGVPGCRSEAAGLGGGGGGGGSLKGMGRRGWRSATTASIWGVS